MSLLLGDVYPWLRTLWSHARNLKATRAKIEADQQKKFRKLVKFVRERSPFYRQVMAERGLDPRTCRPEDFPKITKNDVIDNFDRIVTDPRISQRSIGEFLLHSSDPNELFENQYHVLHTSGTTGTMGYYVYSRKEWIKGASHIARTAPPRWRKRVAYVAATRGHFAGVSLTLTGNRGTNKFFYNIRPFDAGMPVPQIIRELNEFQPYVLSGYAAMMKVLAEAQEQGQLRIKPRQLTNGGEPLTRDTKEYLERVFQAPVVNAYATSEHLYMGLTLPGSDGIHLLEDDLIFEIHNDHLCVTNLFNYTMPLIRYRLDDVLLLDQPDGQYPFTKIREIAGRYEDAMAFTNSLGQRDFIHPIIIVELMVPGLRTWQVELLNETSFLFRARFEPNLNPIEKQRSREYLAQKMRSILDEKLMHNVTFRIEDVNHIPVDPRTGKFRLILRPQPRIVEAAVA